MMPIRAVVFLEGESEETLIRWFFRRCIPDIQVYANYQEFRNSSRAPKALLFTCSGCDDVVPTLEKYRFLVQPPHAGLVIRDLESWDCYGRSKLRQSLVERYRGLGPGILLARPWLESVYAADLDLFSRVLEAQVRAQGGNASLLPQWT
jgi:hypothetical protein